MTRLKFSGIIILLISFFILTTCTTDKTLTGNSGQGLAKPTDVVDIYSPATVDKDKELTPVEKYINRLISWIFLRYSNIADLGVNDCIFVLDFDNPNENVEDYGGMSITYDFRDKYLSKSDKGEVYTACYYLLSEYGIKNNLVSQYYKEHHDLLKSSILIANDLQHSQNNNQILIKNDFAEKLEDMLKVYGNHKNHREIDPVLDYLEYELEKYTGKPKYIITADFQQN